MQRVAEHVVRTRLFGPRIRLRVDLHGVSSFGPGDRRTLIRWEWIEDIVCDDGVVVRSASEQLSFPRGAFGYAPEALAERLQAARSIVNRPEIIGQLSAR